MAQTPSTMLELGTSLPSFTLTNAVDGKSFSSATLTGKPAWVMFICNHCPFVIHVRPELLRASHEAIDAGVAVVAINSNSLKSHPQDGPENMKRLAVEERWRFPFLFDEGQAVAKAFKAACTPDLFLFDGAGKLFYRGQFDESRPSNGNPVTGADFRAATREVLAGAPPPTAQRPSIGCNIKWDVGNAPGYFG